MWVCIHALVIRHTNHIHFWAVLCCHLWPVRLSHVFQYYLINSTIPGKRNDLNIKCVFWYSVPLSTETFLIIRRIQTDTLLNVPRSSCEAFVVLVRCKRNLKFADRCSKSAQISNFMKIRPVRAESLHVESWTDGRTDMTQLVVAFPQCCERV